MKIGYKGTDSEMKCRGFQYELGKEYMVTVDKKLVNVVTSFTEEPAEDKSLSSCSESVVHYCNNMEDCFQFYSSKGNNRFFKVAIKGNFHDKKGKSCTKHIEFLEELTEKEILAAKERVEIGKIEKKLRLEDVRHLQSKFPNLILGGSLSLYLQGAKLKRLEREGTMDFDMIHPYWLDMSEAGVIPIDVKNSGNTFDETYIYNDIKIDLSINNSTKYSTVEFNGHKYKVNTIEQVLEYKIKYAQQQNGHKHKNDIRELIGIK